MYDKKTLQYCKVINLQLIKINEKEKLHVFTTVHLLGCMSAMLLQ